MTPSCSPLPHALPLSTDASRFGLRRLVVPTRIGDVVVHARAGTDGPPTILLHGAAGSWTTWTPLLTASTLQSREAVLADVIALDLPGWGESGDAARVNSVEELSDAVVEVARALGHTEWRIVGHSLGGLLALATAARHSGPTLGVTLVSASGAGVVDAARRPVRGGLRLPGFAGMLLAMRALAVLGDAGPIVVRLLGRLVGMPVLTSPLFAGRVHPSVIAAFADEVRPAAFARAARLAAGYDLGTWQDIACPVRSVRGARDVFAGAMDAAAFAGLIADFREVTLPDAGHFAHIERPDAVLLSVEEVADRVRTGGTTRS
ncbi:MAG TPA: alpha/beta hydrolase [Microbacterium sp.]|nr:alpha/beta hydrolase [Microbacterium sp.]